MPRFNEGVKQHELLHFPIVGATWPKRSDVFDLALIGVKSVESG